MTWANLRDKLTKNPPKRESEYYSRQIAEMVGIGFRLATAEMEAEYRRVSGEYSKELGYWPYFAERKSTYPSIRETKPVNGIYAYGTHDRSEHIGEAIIALAALHKEAIAKQQAWLMPVVDDNEYISWDFDVMEGTEEEVLKTLRSLK